MRHLEAGHFSLLYTLLTDRKSQGLFRLIPWIGLKIIIALYELENIIGSFR